MSIDRVSTLTQSTSLLGELQRLNRQTADTQFQIATGKTAQTYAGLAQDANALLSARGRSAAIEASLETGKLAAARLDVQDVHLAELERITVELRSAMTDALANEDAIGLMARVRDLYVSAARILNETFNGQYLYSGGRIGVAPVEAADFDAFMALPAAADAFAEAGPMQRAMIAPGEQIDVGLAAADVAGPLFDLFRAIGDLDAGPDGPLDGALSDGARAQFQTLIPQAIAVQRHQTEQTAINGLRQARIDAVAERLEREKTVVDSFVSDIENVDLAEAVTRLNRDQIATEAAMRVIAQLNRMSLLDVL